MGQISPQIREKTSLSHFCHHFLYIKGNGKEGKVHFDLVFSKMSESFVAVISLHLPKDRLWFDAPTTSMLYSILRCQPF